MSGEKIQVREGWWRQRCGDIVRVWRNNNDQYPWSSTHNSYTHDGRYRFPCKFTGAENELDLVEFLRENITTTSAE